MTGCRRAPWKRSRCSPPLLLSLCLLLVYLFSLAGGSYGVSIAGGQAELVEPLPQQQQEDDEGKVMVAADNPTAVSSNVRVKRSRDTQQLCGYRLLDALRNVCDRNFVGFSRRSEPGYLGTISNDNGEGQSSEDLFMGGSGNLSPWDVALLTLEYPHSSSSSSGAGDSFLPPSSNPSRDAGSILDYLEMLPQQPPLVSSPTFPWSSGGGQRGNGVGSSSLLPRTVSSSSSKAFALKMLAEPPKTHQRFRRNIIDECCKKPCAMGQMLKYCAITAVGKRSY